MFGLRLFSELFSALIHEGQIPDLFCKEPFHDRAGFRKKISFTGKTVAKKAAGRSRISYT